jgi:hypothetical protein
VVKQSSLLSFKWHITNHYDEIISLDLPLSTNYCIDVQIYLVIYFYAEMGTLRRKSEPINEESQAKIIPKSIMPRTSDMRLNEHWYGQARPVRLDPTMCP